MIHEQTTFRVDGTEVSAMLTLPVGECVEPWPAVFTAPGFAGVKEMLIPDCSDDLAAGGVATLAFDYPGFGSSAGAVRQHIDLPQQLRTFYAALDVLIATHVSIPNESGCGEPACPEGTLLLWPPRTHG